jgi:hypothetical protein
VAVAKTLFDDFDSNRKLIDEDNAFFTDCGVHARLFCA